MSSVYQPKCKDLAKVKVVSSQTYRNNRKDLMLVGSVNRGFDCFRTTQRNKKTGKCTVIKDKSFCKSLISFWSFLYYKLVDN